LLISLESGHGSVMPGLDLALLAALTIVFVAAIVRGFSGFGFSLLSIPALSLLLPMAAVVPVVYALEIAASAHLLPQVWRDVHWRSLAPLIAGTAIGTPLGTWLLAHAPAPPLQLVLAVFVLVAVALMWRGFKLQREPSLAAAVAVGGVAGVANGAFGIGGPPVVLFYLSSPAAAAIGRASVIVYFLVTDIIGLGFAARAGLVTADVFWRALAFAPPLFFGVWLGARLFRTADPELFRRAVLALLAVIALALGAKLLLALA
jgi:uncharacterized protein